VTHGNSGLAFLGRLMIYQKVASGHLSMDVMESPYVKDSALDELNYP
jgi:hypothetical protein